MDLTRSEAIQKFREMWNWIADETEKQGRILNKSAFFVGMAINEIPFKECYLCEYVSQITPLRSRACNKYCPIDWNSEGSTYKSGFTTCDYDMEGYYMRWISAVSLNDWQEAAKLARQIANLPERETEE